MMSGRISNITDVHGVQSAGLVGCDAVDPELTGAMRGGEDGGADFNDIDDGRCQLIAMLEICDIS